MCFDATLLIPARGKGQKAVTHSRVAGGRRSTASQFSALAVITRMRSKTAIKDREKENDIKKQERKTDGQKARKKECKPERREQG